MPIIATGQISIVDLSDGKTLSCYITSNLPKTQILDPNPGGTINPDWTGTPKLMLQGAENRQCKDQDNPRNGAGERFQP